MADDDATRGGIRDPLFLAAALASGALLVGLAWPFLHGEIYVLSDLGRFHVPVRFFYARALAAGDAFLWWPNEFTGFYLHGEGQGVFAHPISWLTYRWLPFEAAFALELLRPYAMLWPGLLALLVRWGLSWSAAAFGALLFTFGSFEFLHVAHLNLVGIVGHLPWMLLAADVALRGEDPRTIARARTWLALLTGSAILHAHPQATWMTLVVLGVLALDFAIRRARAGAGGIAVRRVATIGGFVALGFALGAVQLLPQWEGLATSYRADPGAGYSNTYALAPVNWVQLVAPYLFAGRTVGSNTAGFACYAGAAVPPLAVWAWMRRGTFGAARRWLVLGALLSGLGLLLALGESGLVYRLQQALPVVGLFRAPGRYVVVAELGLAIVAAIAFGDLARPRHAADRPPWRGLVPLLAPVVVSLVATGVIASAAVQSRWPAWRVTEGLALAAGPVLLAGACALVAVAARGHRAALVALVVLTAADLGFYGLSYARAIPTVSLAGWAGFGAPPPVPPGQRLDRGPAALTLRGVRLAGGYAAMRPDRTLPVGLEPGARSDVDLATLRNALRVAAVAGVPGVSPLPRVRLVSAAEPTADVLGRIGAIDVATTALVAEPVAITPGPTGEARLLVDRPGRMRVATSAATPQLLVVSERYHAGWRGDAGPTRCDPVPVYADFIGCVVPPGRHEVELVFAPWSWTWGRRISLGALVALALWLGGTLARQRARGSGSTSVPST